MKLYRKNTTKNRRIGPGELDCAGAHDLMFSELDHENNAAESQALHRHLDGCEACRKEFDERREMIDMINNSAWDVPVKLVPNVMSLIDTMPQDKKTDKLIECGGGKCREINKKSKKKGVFSHRSSFASFGTVAAACAVVMIVLFNRGFIDGASGSAADMADEAYSLQSPVYKSAPIAEEPTEGAAPEANYYTDIDGASFDSFSADDGAVEEAKLTSPDMSEIGMEAAEDRSIDWDLTPNFTASSYGNGELDVYDAFADDVMKEYPNFAVVVCDESVINENELRNSKPVGEKSMNLGIRLTVDTGDESFPEELRVYFASLYLISSESEETAEAVFAKYVDILEQSGEPFASALPVESGYKNVCVVLVNGTETDSSALVDSFTEAVEQPADEPGERAADNE